MNKQLPTIRKLVDTGYITVSIMEEMPQVAEWLQYQAYLAVMDEDLKIVGIVTPPDVQRYPRHLVIDADIRKPEVGPDQNIFEIYELMERVQADCLPVFEQDVFVGVITFRTVIKAVINHLQALENKNRATPLPGRPTA